MLITSACSDRAATAPDVVTPRAPLAAKNGPNAPSTTGRIFFASGQTGNFELYSVNPDGSDLRRLTYTTAREDNPSVSADGKKLVYLKAEPGSPGEIWTANVDGSRQRLLLSKPSDPIVFYRPRFSPDGRRIAFSFAELSTQKTRVAVMDANGGAPTVLTTGDETGTLPSWSPDGQQLAFFGSAPGVDGAQVFTMNADGTNRQPRTNVDPTYFGCCGYAEWSPDGTQILFATTEISTGDRRMYSLRTADWSTVLIGPPNLTGNPPVWSPDGTRILYKHATDLFWMFANGYGATPVISSQDPNGISWSR